MTERTPQDQDKYVVRFPDGLRDRLKQEASANNRSLNAEIIARLVTSLDPLVVDVKSSEDLYRKLDEIVTRVVKTVREDERKTGLPPLDLHPDK